MKIKSRISLVAAAAVLAFANPASAALVAAWDAQDNRMWTNAAVETHSKVTVTALTLHGTVTQSSDYQFSGWSTSINPDNYVGFSVTPDEGYRLNLTNLLYAANNQHSAFSWRYRVIDGSGPGEWITLESRGVGAYVGDLTFSAPIVSTDTVEFGWFASASNTVRGLTFWAGATGRTDELVLSGSVDAIPEPSALLLSGLGCFALLSRRRKTS